MSDWKLSMTDALHHVISLQCVITIHVSSWSARSYCARGSTAGSAASSYSIVFCAKVKWS